MTVPKKEFIPILRKQGDPSEFRVYNESEILKALREWFHVFLDSMPNGEFGEKTMLLILLDNVGEKWND